MYLALFTVKGREEWKRLENCNNFTVQQHTYLKSSNIYGEDQPYQSTFSAFLMLKGLFATQRFWTGILYTN